MRNCPTGSAPYHLKAYCIPVSSLPNHSSCGLRLGSTRLSLRRRFVWLTTGTNYLSPLDTFFLYRLISSASTWTPPSLSVKTLIRVWSPPLIWSGTTRIIDYEVHIHHITAHKFANVSVEEKADRYKDTIRFYTLGKSSRRKLDKNIQMFDYIALQTMRQMSA